MYLKLDMWANAWAELGPSSSKTSMDVRSAELGPNIVPVRKNTLLCSFISAYFAPCMTRMFPVPSRSQRRVEAKGV